MRSLEKKVEDACTQALEVLSAVYQVLSRQAGDPAADQALKDCAWAGVHAKNTLDLVIMGASEEQLKDALKELCRWMAKVGIRINS